MKQSKGDDALIAEIQAAYEKVGEKAKDINTAIGTTAEDGKVRALEEQFEHDARFSSLVVPGRLLLKQGPLIKSFSKQSRNLGKAKTYEFFLFNDQLVYADVIKSLVGKSAKPRYKLKHVCALETMMVTRDKKPKRLVVINSSTVADKGVSKAAATSSKTMSLKAQDPKDREEWFMALTKAIQDTRAKKQAQQAQEAQGEPAGNMPFPRKSSSPLGSSNLGLPNMSGPSGQSKFERMAGVGQSSSNLGLPNMNGPPPKGPGNKPMSGKLAKMFG